MTREMRRWLLAPLLIIAGGIVSLVGMVIWTKVGMASGPEADGINLPPLPMIAVFILVPLMMGIWLIAALTRGLLLVVGRAFRKQASNPN